MCKATAFEVQMLDAEAEALRKVLEKILAELKQSPRRTRCP